MATTPGLENATVLNKIGSFNIGDNGTDEGPSGIINPSTDGALFRTSMTIGGLAFSTSNLCPNSAIITSITGDGTTATVTLTEATELFVGETIPKIQGNSVSGFNAAAVTVTSLIAPTTNSGVLSSTQFTFASSTSGTGLGGTLTATAPCPGAKINPFGADDGNREIELGWAGDGAPIDSSIIANPGGAASTDCINAIDAFAAHPTNLHFALEAFTLGAVRKHATQTRNRIPGVDFSCPTPDQLNAMAAFQEYLGRQEELALCSNSSPSPLCTGAQFTAGLGGTAFATGQKGTQAPYSPRVITFNDSTAQTGEGIFLDSRSSCNLCHLNAGAQGTVGDIGSEQFLPGPPSLTNTATAWTASTTYVPASKPGGNIWSVVTPTDPSNPNFFMALSCSTCKSGGSEPVWPVNVGDTVADGDITWLNLGITAQRLNNPSNGALVGVSTSPARNLSTPTDVDLLDVNVDNLTSTPTTPLDTLVGFTLPSDPGNFITGGPANAPGFTDDNSFNIQSIIEAPRKETFFHNGALATNIEDAVSFYFTPSFDGSAAGALDVGKFPAGRNCKGGVIQTPPAAGGGARTGCGVAALGSLAATYTGGSNRAVLNDLGFFLRALSVVYSIDDAERLTQDTIDILQANPLLPTTVQALNFSNDFNDIIKVLKGARVTLPASWASLLKQAPTLQSQYQVALAAKSPAQLTKVLNGLIALQQSVAAITP